MRVPPQKTLFGLPVAVADLAKHPANGFLNEIVLVLDEHVGDRERVGEVAVPDVVRGRDHRDAPLPHGLRSRETPEKDALAFLEMGADDLRG